jgi:hypothetical protein
MGYVSGIPKSTQEVQHARLIDKFDNSKKEQEQLVKIKKEQEQLGKVKNVNRFDKTD